MSFFVSQTLVPVGQQMQLIFNQLHFLSPVFPRKINSLLLEVPEQVPHSADANDCSK